MTMKFDEFEKDHKCIEKLHKNTRFVDLLDIVNSIQE